MYNLLQRAAEATECYVREMPKSKRKKYGQFFTSPETARFMASLFDLPSTKEEFHILDAGAGSGILATALVERLLHERPHAQIFVTCYETDTNILPLLRENLETLRTQGVSCRLVTENYILSQAAEYNNLLHAEAQPCKYDLIIGNPPYMKIPAGSPEARNMADVCHGAPNLYFLFAAMGCFNLKQDAEMVYIIPRSWTSGAYFTAFRKRLFASCVLRHIHLFASRNKVFDNENVLQETMIIKVCKTQNPPARVVITTSASNKDFDSLTCYHADYDYVVRGSNMYVYLITGEDDEATVRKLSSWKHTLRALGLQMKTGLTVDYREKDMLRQDESENSVPLFYPQHIRNGKVLFPIGKENEYISTEKKSLTQKNANYLFVKRFTAKEESRRLQCGVYLSRKYPQHRFISTQNKINFIDGLHELSDCIVYGLYVLFNSTLYDSYYRILNGSTQVNSTEINSLPMPDLLTIEAMGKQLIGKRDMSETACNNILAQYV